jgi:hypothetical protein
MKLTAAWIALLLLPFLGRSGQAPPEDEPETAEQVVERLYDLVTTEAGETPDWDAVRALFVEEAVVVLRTSREALTVFSLEGFVGDFVAFIEQAGIEETGFTERVLGTRAFVYGDIAHVLVLFDSHVPGSGRPPGQGIDSFELVRLDGEWRIVSITNERPTPENPIPAGLFD